MPQLELQEVLRRVDLRKAELDAHRLLPPQTAASLRESLALDWTYHSNAIEGNTLTLSETKVVLEGITVGGKSLREHLEAVNHREAIGAVEKLVASNKAIAEQDVLTLHDLVLEGINPDEAGRYRSRPVIPAKAGIQGRFFSPALERRTLDSRLRGNDGVFACPAAGAQAGSVGAGYISLPNATALTFPRHNPTGKPLQWILAQHEQWW